MAPLRMLNHLVIALFLPLCLARPLSTRSASRGLIGSIFRRRHIHRAALRATQRCTRAYGTHNQPSEFTRRNFIGAGSGILAVGVVGKAKSKDEKATQSREAVESTLNKLEYRSVPVFTVTDETGASPYFTDSTPSGTPTGFFFFEKADAERILPSVRKEDPKAKVSSIPLPDALKFVQNPSVGLGGEYHLLPSVQQISNANNIQRSQKKSMFVNVTTKIKSADAYDKIPLFYEEKLASVVGGNPTVLVFTKFEDLLAVWEQQIEQVSEGNQPDFKPSVVEFDNLLKAGSDTPNVLVVSSELFLEDKENAKDVDY